jgi:hypothetical protein
MGDGWRHQINGFVKGGWSVPFLAAPVAHPWCHFRQLPVLGPPFAPPLVLISAIAGFGPAPRATPGADFGNCRFWGRPSRDPRY